MEVEKKSGERYPPKSVYEIICSLKRHLEERNGSEALNPLDASDKRYLTTFKSNCSEFYNELFQELKLVPILLSLKKTPRKLIMEAYVILSMSLGK